MAIERMNPDTLRHRLLSQGQRYSPVVKAANLVFTAGHTGRDPNDKIVGGGDIEAQIRQTWRNIEESIKAAGGNLRNIVKVTTYVTDIIALPTWYKVWNELFDLADRPRQHLRGSVPSGETTSDGGDRGHRRPGRLERMGKFGLL